VTSALFDNDSDFLLMGDGAKNLSIGYVGTGEVVHSISLTVRITLCFRIGR